MLVVHSSTIAPAWLEQSHGLCALHNCRSRLGLSLRSVFAAAILGRAVTVCLPEEAYWAAADLMLQYVSRAVGGRLHRRPQEFPPQCINPTGLSTCLLASAKTSNQPGCRIYAPAGEFRLAGTDVIPTDMLSCLALGRCGVSQHLDL